MAADRDGRSRPRVPGLVWSGVDRMALAFAARYRAWQVITGITAATAVVHLASVTLGAGVSEALPTRPVNVVAAVAFFGFALWTLRGDSLSDWAGPRAGRGVAPALAAVTSTFVLAELADKTMLATVTLATQYSWLGVWLGSTVGMVAADLLAIILGRHLGVCLPERAVRYGAAALFAIGGCWLLADALS